MPLPDAPIVLAPNPISHFYSGGGATSRFRGIEPGAHPSPEDWVASTTARFGQAQAGLTRLADGRLLSDAIEADPVPFLGPDHVEAFGSELNLLVKLLDSSQRLIVHAHPDRDFARHHLGTAHGKTEAWVVLSEEQGEVYTGFTREVARDELAGWVDEQRVDEMLAALNVLEVSRGDAVLVPAGLPHAIGPGVFVVELQEPTDFSIALEQRDLALPDLGLGWPVALEAVDRSAWDAGRVASLRGPGLAHQFEDAPGALAPTQGGAHGRGRNGRGERVLPEAADPFFRAGLHGAGLHGAGLQGAGAGLGSYLAHESVVGTGPAVLVVLDGSGELLYASGTIPLHSGQTLLLPHACGSVSLSGSAVALACRPPAPGPLEPARPAL